MSAEEERRKREEEQAEEDRKDNAMIKGKGQKRTNSDVPEPEEDSQGRTE